MKNSNCPCVPLGMRCVYEEHAKDLLGCSCRILSYRVQEFKMALPIIGNWFEPFRCAFFTEFEEE